MSRGEQTVVIAGAGPVGLALACLIAGAPGAERRRIHVVDNGAAPSWSPTEMDLRVYALSRASERLLARVGAWDRIRGQRVSPYRHMSVWEQPNGHGAQPLEFDSTEIGEPNLGHIVEDGLLRTALCERLATHGVDCRWHQSIESVVAGDREARVTVGGETIAATLLVAADGGRSAVRDLMGLRVVERDYGQHALVTHVASGRPHAATAWQRFLPGGPLALLPLADGRSAVVWSLPSAAAEQLAGVADAEFLSALQAASADVLGTLGPVAQRATLPLVARHAWRYCEHRVALVGDAAHTVHPLAGLGMNLGLLDAASLGAVFDAAVRADEDPGDRRVLRRYERERKRDNLVMLVALDALERLFRLPDAFAPLRIAGLGLVARAPLAKRHLMRRALGLKQLGADAP